MQNVLRLMCACALAMIIGCADEGTNDWADASARDVIEGGGVPEPDLREAENWAGANTVTDQSRDGC